MIRSRAMIWVLLVLSAVFCGAEDPLVQRGSIDGREFSEIGKLYLEQDQQVHFRSTSKLYFFSHMYYIGEALKEAGVVSDGKIIYEKPIRITGNYSKAAAVYDFLEEAPLRGHQIVWIDQVEKSLETEGFAQTPRPLFNGKNLTGWSVRLSAGDDAAPWSVMDGAITHSMLPGSFDKRLMTDDSYRDFELSFEYRSSWSTSASLLIRANDQGEGIGLSLDHTDRGHVGLPKSSQGSCRPFSLHETRTKIGFGKTERDRLQYDGRFEYDGVGKGKLLEICQLHEFLKEWDGAYWNVVKVRCVGAEPLVTVWVNGFLICRFNAATVTLDHQNPVPIGGVEKYVINLAGRIGFVVHSTGSEEPNFLSREIKIEAL